MITYFISTRYTSSFLILLSLLLVSLNSSLALEEEDCCIRVFMGYDDRGSIGYHVCEQSMMDQTSLPVTVMPLRLSAIKSVFTREKEPTQLTDFTYSRFIVPYLCAYKGWSIFMDGHDMMVRDDIAKLWALRDDQYAVMVVKHPTFTKKINFTETDVETHSFMGKTIQVYPMLNWSSVMLLNNAKCRALTPEYVNTAGYYDLHQFKWLENLDLIGTLPKTWNHLVGYYQPQEDAKLVHWTLGAPYQKGFETEEHADEWFALREKITAIV